MGDRLGRAGVAAFFCSLSLLLCFSYRFFTLSTHNQYGPVPTRASHTQAQLTQSIIQYHAHPSHIKLHSTLFNPIHTQPTHQNPNHTHSFIQTFIRPSIQPTIHSVIQSFIPIQPNLHQHKREHKHKCQHQHWLRETAQLNHRPLDHTNNHTPNSLPCTNPTYPHALLCSPTQSQTIHSLSTQIPTPAHAINLTRSQSSIQPTNHPNNPATKHMP